MQERQNKRIGKLLELVKNGSFSTPKNCETLLRFYKHCEARGLSSSRHVIYLEKIRMACRIIGEKDFDHWDKDDMEILFSTLNQKGYSPFTKKTEISILKAFFRWFYDTDETPKFLKWLKEELPPNKLTKEMLLTPKEIESMILSTKNVMWKALLATFTSGARPNEIHNLKLQDVTDMGDMIKLYVGREAGKMVKKVQPRATYVKMFADPLRVWVRNHPQKCNPEAWLFVNDKVEKIAYDDLRKVVSRTGEKAGIKKKVFPYLLRHTMGTFLYAKHGSVYARRIMGHAAGSKMEAVYCHLSEADIEDVIRGNKPMQNNGFDFDNVQQSEDQEAEFLKFVSENKMKLLEMWKGWKAHKKNE